MAKLSSIKKIFLVLMVLFAFLSIKQVIAFDGHDIGELPLKACPICAAAETLSFSDHTFADFSLKTVNDAVSVKAPLTESFLYPCIFSIIRNNRAPPESIAV